uniref:AlNc14C325G10624 protein n=1 Tax=Albugo laibachii Nc14 TaxID=890382 RepID=F0WWL2_9STRA|nr:AlNc14C325G10624 [Albugo laibachii Nc14]|eukprot:CCA25836.1 AlNc14C325G10624 [Albugo laibachii Nc14]
MAMNDTLSIYKRLIRLAKGQAWLYDQFRGSQEIWRVQAQHGDKANAYVKAEKEPELNIYLRISQGMSVNQYTLKSYKVERKDELALELKKALYGL